MRHSLACLLAISVLAAIDAKPVSAQTESVLYNFCSQTNCGDGNAPYAGLLLGATGALFGTTYDGGAFGDGTVFTLTPPVAPGGSWTETVLFSFKNRGTGGSPLAALISDTTGALYGTTTDFNGTVFELDPPAVPGAEWTENVLYKGAARGKIPYGSVIADSSGNLYGTTTSGGNNKPCPCGTVFKLTPPTPGNTKWKETVLYEFGGSAAGDGSKPMSGLIADNAGALYGTTSGGGTIGNGIAFKLTPPTTPRGSWTESVLYSFNGRPDGNAPVAGLVADSAGHLYGTTTYGGVSSAGVVFALTPPVAPGGSWTESVLYSFNGGSDGQYPSYGGLIGNSTGALYGMTSVGGGDCSLNGSAGCGTVFKLTPPATPGGAWTETVLYRFCSQSDCSDGAFPYGGLTADATGNLYGTTSSGGAFVGGTVFKLTGTGFVP